VKQQRATKWHEISFDANFWAQLIKIDEVLAERVRCGGCRRCGGALYRADYPRKPRWGQALEVDGWPFRRMSLCCGREGCRRRSTPPSVRFLGRRVYVGVVVMLATIAAEELGKLAASASSRVPARTLERWRGWWSGAFASSRFFSVARGTSLGGEIVGALLPRSLLERFPGSCSEMMISALRFISPITTASIPLEALFLMDR
jgi:hypothetical protein